jgi:RimJ/RimL family protein N-acetyltransferase
MPSLPSPAIATARLDLRELGQGDVALVTEVATANEWDALPPGVPDSPVELAWWLAAGHHLAERDTTVHVMMIDRAAGRMVGSVGVFQVDWEVRSAEIGCGVRGDARGKGYATEALAAVARWLLTEGGMQRAWVGCHTDNAASMRLAEKAGFRREGTLRRASVAEDGLRDLAVFSLLDDEIETTAALARLP